MTKLKTIKPVFVDFIPEQLDDGFLYISQEYKTAIHKCACGCGAEVVTPLVPTEWSIQVYGDAVTLSPSIGNWSITCRSHYWIRNNQIVWSGSMTQEQINRGRMMDRLSKDAYFGESKTHSFTKPTGVQRLVKFIKGIFGK